MIVEPGVCDRSRGDSSKKGKDGQMAGISRLESLLIKEIHIKIEGYWASLVTQRLRICLPMQGTRDRALVREDPTCHRATKPVSHNY